MIKIMKVKVLILFFLTSVVVNGQEKWTNYKKENYQVEYPENWKLDTKGSNGSSFIIFSPIEKNETFRENVNLVVQDLKGSNYTLASYAKLSEDQIKTMLSDSEVLESSTVKKGENSYHVIVWSGTIGGKKLKLKQHLYVKNEKAFVLSFTATDNSFDRFKTTSNKILESFTLKDE